MALKLVLTAVGSEAIPAGAAAALNYVVNLYDSLFTNTVTTTVYNSNGVATGTVTNDVTVNINYQFGDVGGSDSSYYTQQQNYSSTLNILKADSAYDVQHNVSPDQVQAVSTLPPSNSSLVTMSNGNAIGLGLTTTSLPATITFSDYNPISYSYGPNQTVPAGSLDFVALAEHEISEILGRNSVATNSLLNLYRYTAPGVADPTAASTSAYFSIDGGKTNLGTFANNIDGFDQPDGLDAADWDTNGTVSAPGATDAFNASATPGVLAKLSTVDIEVMNALGWNSTTTDVTTLAAYSLCFFPGTLIAVPDGWMPVETLVSGDLVMTTEGVAKPIVWLGRQTISARFADPLRVLPIRIKAGALGENLPSRDLLVSPDHALLIDGALIQAGALVNAVTITRETDVPPTFVYYHVELADHSLIIAEGIAAETFIDNVDRLAFDNWQEHEALELAGCSLVEMPYPRAKSARQIPAAIRMRLSQRISALAAKTLDIAA